MIALRLLCTIVIASCLAGSWISGRYDGAWLLGLIAAVVLLWTFGLFSRAFWLADGPEDFSRLDRLDRGDRDV